MCYNTCCVHVTSSGWGTVLAYLVFIVILDDNFMVRCAGGHTVAWSYSWLRESPVVKFIDLRYVCQCQGVTNSSEISTKVQCPDLMMPKLMCHTWSSLLYALLCWGLHLVKFNFMGYLAGKCLQALFFVCISCQQLPCFLGYWSRQLEARSVSSVSVISYGGFNNVVYAGFMKLAQWWK